MFIVIIIIFVIVIGLQLFVYFQLVTNELGYCLTFNNVDINLVDTERLEGPTKVSFIQYSLISSNRKAFFHLCRAQILKEKPGFLLGGLTLDIMASDWLSRI